MNTILDALQEGRLFELPENDKAHALQFLAHIIEAFPETPVGTDVVGLVMKREAATNTAIGRGWACPHTRVPYDEDLMCVMGWSPKGIDYGAPDGRPVTLVVMYLVPTTSGITTCGRCRCWPRRLKPIRDLKSCVKPKTWMVSATTCWI